MRLGSFFEDISRWLAATGDERTPDAIERWVARVLRLDEQRAHQALRSFVASEGYSIARAGADFSRHRIRR